MKNLQFFKKIFNKISRLFQFFLIYRIIGENLDRNLENLEICIYTGFLGRRLPDASEFIEIVVEKSMKTSNFCIVLNEFLPFFQFLKNFIEYFADIVPIIY